MRKNKDKKYYTFHHPVYPFKIEFYIGHTKTELNKKGWGIGDKAAGFTWQDEMIIRIWVEKKRLGEVPTYVHELYHACHFMFEECGVKDYSEAMAYNLEYMIDQYQTGLREYRRREKQLKEKK